MNIDRYGRPIEDLRITVTHVCNFSCFFCHMEGEDIGEKSLTPREIAEVAKIAKEFGIKSVKLTGGEPTVRRDILEIVYLLKNYSKINEISMTTNGFLLAKLAYKLKEAGLDRINISLHATNKEKFKEITGVDAFDKVIEGIKAAIDANLRPIKLNFVLNKKNSNEIFKIIEISESLGIDELHLIELHPVGLGKVNFLFHESLDEVEKILSSLAIRVEIRSKHYRPRYKLPSGLIVEVVKPYANPLFCAGCNRVRLTADGKLKTCLYREDKVIDILDILRGDFSESERHELLKRAFRIAIVIREPNFKYTTKSSGEDKKIIKTYRLGYE
ncbi:MAG: GTP 3',8-cyclase MoaA [Sulfolobaceae archaeon]